jgi:hypothetical protein
MRLDKTGNKKGIGIAGAILSQDQAGGSLPYQN